MNYSVVMVYEGATESVFYPLVIQEIKKQMHFERLPFQLFHVNVEGIGNFKTKLLAKLKNEVIPKCQRKIVVVLCYDTDVFEFNPHPPVNWKKLEENILSLGVMKVIHISAKHSIEDFFLKDLDGLCSYLGIKVPSKLPGDTGLNKIENLFKKGNRIYMKGHEVKDFIQYLDISKIVELNHEELQGLYDLFV